MAMAHKGLLIRAEPDTTSKAIGVLPFGIKGEVLNSGNHSEIIGDKSGVWLNINYSGKDGWIFSGYTYMSDYESFEDILDYNNSEYRELNSDGFLNPQPLKEFKEFSNYEDQDYKRLVKKQPMERVDYEIILKEFDEKIGNLEELGKKNNAYRRVSWTNLFFKNKKTGKLYSDEDSLIYEVLKEKQVSFDRILFVDIACRHCCGGDFSSHIYVLTDNGVYRIYLGNNSENDTLNCSGAQDIYGRIISFSEQRENRYNVADKIIYTYIKRPKCEESKHRIDNPILEDAFVIIKINPRFPEIFRFYNQGIPTKYKDEWELAEREK